ncbi:hypothetical protein C0L75_02920 [Clostridium perfringens]
MNLKRKVIPMELDGKKYEFILDFESALEFQNDYGKSIFVGLSKISEEKDVKALVCLIAACCKNEKGKPVGLDFVKKIDLMSGLEYFMDKITALVDNSLPKKDESDKKK